MNTDDESRGQRNARALPPRLDPRAGRPSQQSSSEGPGAAGPRSGGRRLTWTGRIVAGLLSLTILVTSGWGWYLGRVAEATVNRTDAIPDSGNDDTSHSGAAMNLLLVGNDSREDLSEQQLADLSAGADSGINTDTMILVHIPA